jgi:toxin ParE1/3/4
MTGEVYKLAAARRDLVQHFVYLAENAGLDAADRFLANAERCFIELAQQPEIGSPLALKRPELAGMRKWRVPDFENFLVFNCPR